MLGRACRRLGCPILALTATASPDVRRDIVQVLDLRTPVVAVASFDRPNLEWRVEEARGHGSKIARLWGHLRAQRGPAIVYAGTRRTVEAIRRHIAARGLRAVAYHAGLAAHERAEVQAEFMQDRAQVVVATTAFGMGIDKPDVRSVLHYQLPSSLESYYQEAGRAGRDGRSARCIALYAPLDARLHQRFVDRNRPDPVAVRRVWRRLVTWHRRTGRPASLSALVRRTSKRNGRERIESVLAALRRDGRIEPVDPGTDAWEGTPSAPLGSLSWVPLPGAAPPDLTRMYRLRRAALDQIAAVERYATTRRCRRRELLEYFGQRTSGDPCGACDRCRRARS
jgi:ATP-dependent DNA helicase RecQ